MGSILDVADIIKKINGNKELKDLAGGLFKK